MQEIQRRRHRVQLPAASAQDLSPEIPLSMSQAPIGDVNKPLGVSHDSMVASILQEEWIAVHGQMPSASSVNGESEIMDVVMTEGGTAVSMSYLFLDPTMICYCFLLLLLHR